MDKFSLENISLILYGISLFIPSFFGSWTLGINALILGWMGISDGIIFIFLPWLANLLFFVNFIFNQINIKVKISLSIVTILFALFVIGLKEIPETAGGSNSHIIPGIGFIFWISSFIVLLFSQIKEKKLRNQINF